MAGGGGGQTVGLLLSFAPLRLCLLLLLLLLLGGYDGRADAREVAKQAEVAGSENGARSYRRAIPIVEPDQTHTHLKVSREGLDVIARIQNPIAVVAVIGPYRSGKSFLLNQLLGLTCNEGFGVGHMRDTKTKGVWVWGEPLTMEINGVTTSVLFLDTEGFESLGKSTVYDDRIFALAAIVSSVLIYNLPETVKEADIAKLSFAVELAEEFYGRVNGREASFRLGRLLWLIQRDFLEGKSVQQMVEEAIRPVPNEEGNPDVEQVNRIRQSLATMTSNLTAFGLRQPHLMRTKLCEMKDGELDPVYVQQRTELKKLMESMIVPKLWGGGSLNGKEFAEAIEQTLQALNEGAIPSAGSVVEAFNRAVRERCLSLYLERMSHLRLPAMDSQLREAHGAAAEAARTLFEKERFGQRAAEEAEKRLEDELGKAGEKIRDANALASSQRCESLYAECEDQLAYLENMRLPSMAKFDAGLKHCNQSAETACVGPSREHYAMRLNKMWARERVQFQKEYNQRLFNWLVVASLALVALARFVLKSLLLEAAAWALFVFLEAYTRIFWSAEGLYYNATWRTFVGVWEALVFNPVVDLDRWAIPLSWGAIMGMILFRCYRWRRRLSVQSGGRSGSQSARAKAKQEESTGGRSSWLWRRADKGNVGAKNV